MKSHRPLDLPEHLYEKLADPTLNLFYSAPVLILISGRKNALWKAEDCALAAQNIMLGAVASALGTCWIGLCQPFLDTREATLQQHLIADGEFQPTDVCAPPQ
jgi:nitroreductase